MQACQHRLTTQSVMHKKQGSGHKYIVTMRSTRETAVTTGQFQYNLCQALPKIFISQKLYFFFAILQCFTKFYLYECFSSQKMYWYIFIVHSASIIISITQSCQGSAKMPSHPKLGSTAVHAPSSVQTTYIATQDPQILHDQSVAWSHDLRMLRLCKPLCAFARQTLKA